MTKSTVCWCLHEQSHQVLYNRNKHLERDKLCHGSRGDQFRSDKHQTTRPPNKSRPILRPLERVIKASSHKIVKKSQTVAGSLRSQRVYVNKIGDCLPILCELALTCPHNFQNVLVRTYMYIHQQMWVTDTEAFKCQELKTNEKSQWKSIQQWKSLLNSPFSWKNSLMKLSLRTKKDYFSWFLEEAVHMIPVTQLAR